MALSIPTRAEEITAAWLTEALAERYPGAVVTSLHQGSVIHGTATKVRLLLDYNDAGHRHGLPPTMWYKGGLEAHSDTEDMLIVYAGEASFFGRLADKIDLNLPKTYASVIDPQTKRSFILLEDLLWRNAAFGHASKPISADETALLLNELAKLHGRFWRSSEIDDYPWLKGGGSLLQSCDVLLSQATWDRCIALPRGRYVQGPMRDFDVLRKSILTVMGGDVERANCMVHGDGHIGNTFRTRGGVSGFLDWQSSFHGVWAHDVTYLMITAMTIEDRRHNERDLLDHYLTKARSQGVDLSWEEAWLEYRRHTMYACCWSMCLPEWQAEETCSLVTERGMAAAADLDSLSVL